MQRGHDRLTVFGIVEPEEARLIRGVARALQARGVLVPTEHGGLQLGGDARAILKGEMAVEVAIAARPERGQRRRKGQGAEGAPADDPLFEALRALRREIAREMGLPPYVVFHDSTLREMAAAKPQTMAALGEISGVGARKRDAYGERFLQAIQDFAQG